MTVAVIGLGLIGGSLAQALRDAGCTVWGVDASPVTRDLAQDAGIHVVESLAEFRTVAVDLVVVATPLPVMTTVFADLARYCPGVLVMDVGSVKGAVRTMAQEAGVGSHYVGAHPMSGTEHEGFIASNPALMVGIPWAVTIDHETQPQNLFRVLHLLVEMLHGTVRIMSDDIHDESVAAVSHVPHVLATALVQQMALVSAPKVAWGLAAGSFRDGTRVAQTSPDRTLAMVSGNSIAVAEILRRISADLNDLAAALLADTAADGFFHRAPRQREYRQVWEKTHDGSKSDPGRVLEIRLGVPGWVDELTQRGAEGAVVDYCDPSRQLLTLRTA